ncbi:MAG: CHRD domain-containing protein [Nitrososphaeraceae archaeon]
MLKGPLAGKAVEIDLVKTINDEEAFVNVHTTENPDGEIRGQIISGGTRYGRIVTRNPRIDSRNIDRTT